MRAGERRSGVAGRRLGLLRMDRVERRIAVENCGSGAEQGSATIQGIVAEGRRGAVFCRQGLRRGIFSCLAEARERGGHFGSLSTF